MTRGEEPGLPLGWSTSTIGEAATLVRQKVDPSATPEVPYVGLEHIEAHTMRLLGHGRASDVTSTKTKFSAGDVLYGKLRPYLNKVARPTFDGICSTDILVFRDSQRLDAGYLAYFLNQLRVANEAHHLSNGIELPRVDWKSLSQLPIKFPLDKREQRAIVHEIEQSRLLGSSASGHLTAARLAIDRFRQAMLAAACSGRLTADWRESHPEIAGSVDELLRDLRSGSRGDLQQESPSEGLLDLPETWRVAKGAEVFTFVTSGSRGWAKYYSDQGPAFLRVGNLDRHRLDLDLAAVQAVTPPSSAESRRTRVQSGDLLISITAEVGMVGVAPADLGEAYVNQHVAIARPHPALSSRYLAAFVAAPSYGEAQLDALQRGATKAGLGLDDIRALRIPIPPAEEQVEIARRVDRLMSIADSLDSRIDAASRRIDRSSQAVLAKAFRGELQIEVR